MERMAQIKVTKSILLIPEKVLWQYLPSGEIAAGIRRGKGYKRSQRVAEYERSRIYPTHEDINGNEGLRAFYKNESEELK